MSTDPTIFESVGGRPTIYCIWAFTLGLRNTNSGCCHHTRLATGQGNPRRANKLIIVFGKTMLDLVEIVEFGLILAFYLIPASFSLKLFLQAVDTSGILNDC